MLKLKHLDLSLEVLETLSFSFLGQLIFMPKFCYSTDFGSSQNVVEKY